MQFILILEVGLSKLVAKLLFRLELRLQAFIFYFQFLQPLFNRFNIDLELLLN